MIVLKFFFEWSVTSTCLWSGNEKANEVYGVGPISLDYFSLPESLKNTITDLCEEFQTALDWDDPGGPLLWTDKHWSDFNARARQAYNGVCAALGNEITVLEHF